MVLEEEEEEEEEEEPVVYVQHDGRWWGASGIQLASGTAGGWPLPMGPRLAILSGGLHGSSAVGRVTMLRWCFWAGAGSTVDTCSSLVSSVHRQWWLLLLFAETGTHSSNCARLSTTLSWRRGRFPWSRAADHSDSQVAVY